MGHPKLLELKHQSSWVRFVLLMERNEADGSGMSWILEACVLLQVYGNEGNKNHGWCQSGKRIALEYFEGCVFVPYALVILY